MIRDLRTDKIYSSLEELRAERLADELQKTKDDNESSPENEEIKNQLDSTPKKIIRPKFKIKKLSSTESSGNIEEKKNEIVPPQGKLISLRSLKKEPEIKILPEEKPEEEFNDSQQQNYSNSEFKTMNGIELLNFERKNPQWIVEQLIPRGLTVCAGDPKSGKSRLSRLIAIEIIFGNPLFKYFKSEKGGVLLISYEEFPDTVSPQIQALLENRDIEKSIVDKEINNLHYIKGDESLGIGLELENYIKEQYNEFKDPKLKLVVIDTLGGGKPSDNTNGYNYYSEYKILLPLQNLAMRLQIGILVIHHTSKRISNDPFLKVSGTQGITGVANCVWILDSPNNSGETTLHVMGRERGKGDYKLKFNEDKVEWEYIGKKIIHETTPERQEILDVFIDNLNQELKTGFIAIQLGKSQPNISIQLKKLKKEGFLKDGSKYGFYKLSDNYRKELEL